MLQLKRHVKLRPPAARRPCWAMTWHPSLQVHFLLAFARIWSLGLFFVHPVCKTHKPGNLFLSRHKELQVGQPVVIIL